MEKCVERQGDLIKELYFSYSLSSHKSCFASLEKNADGFCEMLKINVFKAESLMSKCPNAEAKRKAEEELERSTTIKESINIYRIRRACKTSTKYLLNNGFGPQSFTCSKIGKIVKEVKTEERECYVVKGSLPETQKSKKFVDTMGTSPCEDASEQSPRRTRSNTRFDSLGTECSTNAITLANVPRHD